MTGFHMNYVIAVAGPIGGGKTALVKAIANQFNNAATIYFDHYEKITESPAQDLEKWIEQGASFHDFHIPGLARDLGKLKQGNSILDPLTKTEIKPTRYIVFEMPLGKEHRDTAGYIDLLIWINIPFDVALVRKLKEFTGNFLTRKIDGSSREFIVWMDRYLDNYFTVVRKVLQIQQQKVSLNADIIVDGMKDIDSMVCQATKEILAKIP
jgi:uridine kinase